MAWAWPRDNGTENSPFCNANLNDNLGRHAGARCIDIMPSRNAVSNESQGRHADTFAAVLQGELEGDTCPRRSAEDMLLDALMVDL